MVFAIHDLVLESFIKFELGIIQRLYCTNSLLSEFGVPVRFHDSWQDQGTWSNGMSASHDGLCFPDWLNPRPQPTRKSCVARVAHAAPRWISWLLWVLEPIVSARCMPQSLCSGDPGLTAEEWVELKWDAMISGFLEMYHRTWKIQNLASCHRWNQPRYHLKDLIAWHLVKEYRHSSPILSNKCSFSLVITVNFPCYHGKTPW